MSPGDVGGHRYLTGGVPRSNPRHWPMTASANNGKFSKRFEKRSMSKNIHTNELKIQNDVFTVVATII
jgi:hypothetical protein